MYVGKNMNTKSLVEVCLTAMSPAHPVHTHRTEAGVIIFLARWLPSGFRAVLQEGLSCKPSVANTLTAFRKGCTK